MKNIALPIHAFRDQIVEAVRNNSVVVITAETGAGKSTQVPQYLLDEGYDLVVTQPRRLAARTVAERVAEEIGETIGGTIGYRTAVDRQDSAATWQVPQNFLTK
jgi:ATP-dependent helicase HrpA